VTARDQAWLAVSEDAQAWVSGDYFFHLRRRAPNPQAKNPARQDRLMGACRRLSSVALPD